MPWPWDKCKHIIHYDGRNISFSGLEGPEVVSFKISDLQIKKDVLQAACDIAQMYDLFAYRNCRRIQEFPKDTLERSKFILDVTKNEERIIEFLAMLRVAIARSSEEIEKALADWIAFTFTKRLREEAPIIPEKVRAGKIVRESPPIEEYNGIKRNVAKAKMSFPYLRDALENPHFDINKVYAISNKG
jgi:hypothetical protein